MNLEGKLALVTGSGRGIGRATALKLASQGCNIVVNYFRRREAAEQTAKDIEALGVKAEVIRANIVDPDKITTIFDMISENFEILQDEMTDNLLKQFGIPIEMIISETVKALKKELGEDDFTEELIESKTENQTQQKSIPVKVEDRTTEIELIDQMLKRPGLSEVESDKLLDRRSELQNKM